MSYKTNPTVNRIKHTTGWQNINQNSTTDFRNLLFLKNWLKLKKWYFLSLQQFTNYKLKLLFITALRRPKKKYLNQKVVPALHVIEDETFNTQDVLQFRKKNSLIKLHYKKRKKLFKFIALEKNLKHNFIKNKEIISINRNFKEKYEEINPLKKAVNLKKIRNKWLYRIQSSNFKIFFVKHNLYNQFLNLKYLNYSLIKLKKTMYGTYDPSFLGWEKMIIKLKNIKRKKKWFSNFSCHFNYKRNSILRNNYYKSKLSATKIEKNIMFFIKAKHKLRNFKKIFLNFKFKRVIFDKKNLKFKKKRIKKKYTNFLDKKKKNFAEEYWKLKKKQKENKIVIKKKKFQFKIKRKKKLYSYFKLYKKLKKKQKLNVFNSRKKFFLYQYINWKKNYIRTVNEDTDMINDFLELVSYVQNFKKNFKPIYKKNLQRFRKWKKRVFKNARFSEIKQQNSAYDNRKKNKKQNIFERTNNRIFLKWRAFFAINKTRKQEILLKKKIKYNSFRINYIFKKIIKFVLNNQPQKTGKLIVRFLQPVGLLLNTAKIRRNIAKDYYLKRYKRNKLYRKFIPILAALSRYWDPQPLLQQIAYEMQKTKKHWPLLKTIRGLFTILKPPIFTGYRIAVRGKISSSDRTRVFYFKNGRMPLNSFNSRILYSIWHSHARTGVFSIKSWLYFSDSDLDKKNEENKNKKNNVKKIYTT